MTEERIWLSPFNYCQNNPIMRIDPDGMLDDEYIFDSEGNYTGKVKKPGEHTGLILGDENQKPMKFSFADPVNDPKAIDKEKIKGVRIIKDEVISKILKDSDVNKKENQDNCILFALTESDASNLNGDGKMDYVVNGKFEIDGVKRSMVDNVLYITQSKSGGVVAHNNKNFGNFLWGAGMQKLGFPRHLARLGAHYNNMKDHHYSGLDSKDDQYSIKLGYEWSKQNK